MRKFILVLTLFVAQSASADSIDRILGTWQSADGNVRISYSRDFGRHWVNTRTFMASDKGWQLVGMGAMYRRPGDHVWHGSARTANMNGVELFEFTVEMPKEGEYVLKTKAYMDTGKYFETVEDWVFDGEDVFKSTVYMLEGDEKKLFLESMRVRVAPEI